MLFDIGWPELMLIGIVALVVIGPKDLPRALRVAGSDTACRGRAGTGRPAVESPRTFIRRAGAEPRARAETVRVADGRGRQRGRARKRPHAAARPSGRAAQPAVVVVRRDPRRV